jgi:hypothetical protein
MFTKNPSEFFVVDLDTGHTTIDEARSGLITIDRYKPSHELRAGNGRIFFPGSGVSVAYYDPEDETVKQLGRLLPATSPDNVFYKGEFGPDGMLYLGTESNGLPTIVQLDPDTLTWKVLGTVGKARVGYSYAYYFDIDPPWVYVAVGENPWELAALNIKTGESRILATRSNKSWMKLRATPAGIVATLIDGLHTPQETQEDLLCSDGKTIDPHRAPARTGFDAKPRMPELKDPPEVDLEDISPNAAGVGTIRWRATKTDPWKETKFSVKYTSPVDIESLVALPDGSVMGTTAQYRGFFRFVPSTRSVTAFGHHGPSRASCAVDHGIVYVAGYPNGTLYAYDPAAPWRSTGNDQQDKRDPAANPRALGNFAESGTKYTSFLEAAPNHRVYYAGYRERDGLGGGVGYYDIGKTTFAGHFRNLDAFNPHGLLVLDHPLRVIYAGHLRKDVPGAAPLPSEAQLVVFDANLVELERLEVKPGLRDTGRLFATPNPDVIVGVVASERAIYRYDLHAKKLLGWKSLDGEIGAATQRPGDLSIWVVRDRSLVRVDPVKLTLQVVGAPAGMPADAEHLTWQGQELYLSSKGELLRVLGLGK